MNERLQLNSLQENGGHVSQAIVLPPFPDSLRRQLEQRYESVFCSLARIGEPNTDGSNIAVYLAGGGASPATIVIYRRARGMITVLNENFAMSAYELEQMARYVFAACPDVKLISLPSVATDKAATSLMNQRFNSSEDIVISLPTTPEYYRSALGSNTRSAIRRSEKLLEQRYPQIEFTCYDQSSCGRDLIEQLVNLSCERIMNKRQVPSHNDRTIAELMRMVDAYGVVLVARMGEQLCGGVICTQVGKHFYMHVVTHNPSFDDIRLGMFCCYKSICEAIRRGATEYHLLSGKYDYKFRFLGHQRDFEKIVIYRSFLAVLPSLPIYIKTIVRGKGRLTKQRWISWRRKWKT